MNHASLFSGIGGFDLAAEWMGWRNVFHVERDPFCQQVLAHHFPNSQPFDDVTTFDGRPWRGSVDILTGGFPCQPYSTAGKRMGKDDERHLWPEMRRIISEIAPTFVVGENVRGLTNWNGGVVFEEVCADLEAEGYEVWTGILPAAAVGAPHRRDRVWFIAHAKDVRDNRRPAEVRRTQRRQDSEQLAESIERGEIWDAAHATNSRAKRVRRARTDAVCEFTDAANADRNQRPEGRMHQARPKQAKRYARSRDARPDPWKDFPTQSPICGGNDGLPRELDGITFSKWRNESIKAYGNAIVPQVAYQLFKAINESA